MRNSGRHGWMRCGGWGILESKGELGGLLDPLLAEPPLQKGAIRSSGFEVPKSRTSDIGPSLVSPVPVGQSAPASSSLL